MHVKTHILPVSHTLKKAVEEMRCTSEKFLFQPLEGNAHPVIPHYLYSSSHIFSLTFYMQIPNNNVNKEEHH